MKLSVGKECECESNAMAGISRTQQNRTEGITADKRVSESYKRCGSKRGAQRGLLDIITEHAEQQSSRVE